MGSVHPNPGDVVHALLRSRATTPARARSTLHAPTYPPTPPCSTSSDFHTTLVWPEEPSAENEGAYVAVAPGGDTYVAWERNVDTNLFFGETRTSTSTSPSCLPARTRRSWAGRTTRS